MAIQKLPSTGDAPRSTGVPASLVPGGDADSAGYSWAGRTFDHHDTVFADDDGTVPEAWRTALASVRAAGSHAELAEAQAEALVALAQVRLLVPLVAEAGDTGVTETGRIVEKSQELSIVTVGSPDGRRALPVFTSVAAMRDWNPEARPIPVPGPQAALAAAQEGTDIIIIDPGTPAQEFAVRRTALEAMALGQALRPSWADPAVAEAFAASIGPEAQILAVELAPGDPEVRLRGAETNVILTLKAGLQQAQLQVLIQRLQARWSESAVIAERVDSLRVVLR